jgi:hypothetical protein
VGEWVRWGGGEWMGGKQGGESRQSAPVPSEFLCCDIE